MQNLELKLVGDISVECNSDIDCPIGLFCEKSVCEKPGSGSNGIIKGIHTESKNVSYFWYICFYLTDTGFQMGCQKEPNLTFKSQFQNLNSSKSFWFFCYQKAIV